ncbi:MAG: membrane-anchored protein YejM (alkaline phosphatase superfamily) [Paraglaciecola sp.]|jgi:membrane-anchored protein YejM (alkaline phosphatase superfamily)
MLLTETPRRKLVTQLVNWGHWFALLNMIIAIIIAAVYILNSPTPGTLLGTTFLFTNWVSHIGFLTFIGFVIFILPLCYLVPNAKVVKNLSSVLAALALALLAFDALLYNKYGVHLSFSSAQLIRDEAQTVIAEFGWQQWGFLLLLFVVWLSFQLIVANALWQRIDRLLKRKLGLPITTFFVICFVNSHAMHIWADANLYQPIVQQDNMFPLSYPATAKTLMAKYSLLDIENYHQRKELQFEAGVQGINYPAEPVYCAVSKDSKVLLLLQIDGAELPLLDSMNIYNNHYAVASSLKAAQLSTLFGLPELYHSALANQTPLLLDLPRKLGASALVYSNVEIELIALKSFITDWTIFAEKVQSSQANLAIGFVTRQQISELVSSEVLASYQVIISPLASDENITNVNQSSVILSNISLETSLSSTEDFAPTILNLMGCSAEAKAYSTGQNLSKKGRNWLVTTQGGKVIVLHNNQRIEVFSNGVTKVFNLQTGDEEFAPADTNLLSQAIKRLSEFSSSK